MKKLVIALTSVLVLSLFLTTTLAIPKEAAREKPSEPLESITFIHYKDGRVKVTGGSCTKLMGVKWGSLPVSYVISPANYNQEFVAEAISLAAEEWDSHTSKELFSNIYSIGNAEWGVADLKNVYTFGEYPDSSVIAVTRIWYTRRTKQIVDYDVLFNTWYNWFDCSKTSCTEENKGMDLQSIALHETGHGIGLADVYSSACSYVVMYGYSSYGEVKRELALPDIAGLQRIYGA
ncbi:MAG: matrixin family metalloprotease [Candidatus Aenigmarchaeota archaeon]|nr:matrixin family metalloprotease [Candidatus Aenigmarchaeota archaeon]